MRPLIVIAALLATGCEERQPIPTAAENRELDEAANLLDQAPNALDAVDSNALDTAESR